MRTYPDRGHGSFTLFGEPDGEKLTSLTLLDGRKLLPGDTNAIVLTQQGLRLAPGLRIGDPVTISVGNKPITWTLVGMVREIGGNGAYVNRAALDAVAGDEGQKFVRVAYDRASAGSMVNWTGALSASFDRAGIGVERSTALRTLYAALLGHIEVPVTMLVASAVLLGIIGGLGLASMTAINVLERTREIGILKAIGATPATVTRLIVLEILVIALISWAAAVLLALPLTYGIDQLGAQMFGSPLTFILPAGAVAGWLALSLVIALAASSTAAIRAGRLVVREALVTT
jgi:putative ABC transport system permease protein